MSAEHDRVRELVERIARRVSQDASGTRARASSYASNDAGDELSRMRQSLEELKRKLASIEEHLSQEKDDASFETRDYGRDEGGGTQPEGRGAPPPNAARSPWLSGVYVPATHPSQEKFGVEEAAVSELVDYFEKEKVCELEPGGKPCTHCAMCNTRGF